MPILYDIVPKTLDGQGSLSELDDEGVSYVSLPFFRGRTEKVRQERVWIHRSRPVKTSRTVSSLHPSGLRPWDAI